MLNKSEYIMDMCMSFFLLPHLTIKQHIHTLICFTHTINKLIKYIRNRRLFIRTINIKQVRRKLNSFCSFFFFFLHGNSSVIDLIAFCTYRFKHLTWCLNLICWDSFPQWLKQSNTNILEFPDPHNHFFVYTYQ